MMGGTREDVTRVEALSVITFSWDIREYRSLSTKNGPAGSLHNLPG